MLSFFGMGSKIFSDLIFRNLSKRSICFWDVPHWEGRIITDFFLLCSSNLSASFTFFKTWATVRTAHLDGVTGTRITDAGKYEVIFSEEPDPGVSMTT